MGGNQKIGSESVSEKPNQTEEVKKSKSRVEFPRHFEKPETKIKQPQFFQCLFDNRVNLMIKFYKTDSYVYDSARVVMNR